MVREGVYLLHFSRPFRHAKHYLGWARRIPGRVAHHRNGTGANLTARAVAEGIELLLVRIWEGADRAQERSLKNAGAATDRCPLCLARSRPVRLGNGCLEACGDDAPCACGQPAAFAYRTARQRRPLCEACAARLTAKEMTRPRPRRRTVACVLPDPASPAPLPPDPSLCF